MTTKILKTDEEWRRDLTPEQYDVLRQKGTERPFTGQYCRNKDRGVYRCAACGSPLFSSETKYESGSGWPSFWAPISSEVVHLEEDHSLGMHRVEVLCAACESHLGHVFTDGPKPTGQRFCMNSLALRLDVVLHPRRRFSDHESDCPNPGCLLPSRFGLLVVLPAVLANELAQVVLQNSQHADSPVRDHCNGIGVIDFLQHPAQVEKT